MDDILKRGVLGTSEKEYSRIKKRNMQHGQDSLRRAYISFLGFDHKRGWSGYILNYSKIFPNFASKKKKNISGDLKEKYLFDVAIKAGKNDYPNKSWKCGEDYRISVFPGKI